MIDEERVERARLDCYLVVSCRHRENAVVPGRRLIWEEGEIWVGERVTALRNLRLQKQGILIELGENGYVDGKRVKAYALSLE